MHPTATRTPIAQRQRPWRPLAPEQRRPAAVIRAFAAPVVRELPPRRDPRAAGGW